MPEAYLYARCASDMAVLYWDKPSLAAADAVYTVFINDKKLADTKKNKLHHPESGTRYRLYRAGADGRALGRRGRCAYRQGKAPH